MINNNEQHLDSHRPAPLKSYFFWSGLCIAFCISILSFGYKYWLPDKMFWDENYHIASAYKYLNGVFFMEQHPPLGKLIIALSQKIWNVNHNLDTEAFLKVDHIKDTPDGFSFIALRLPSVLSAILASLVFYLIIFEIFKNGLVASLCTVLFSLDNTILVHSRSAMLEGPQLLTIFIATLILSKVILQNKITNLHWLSFGITLGIAISIKLNSAIILIYALFLSLQEYKKSGIFASTVKLTASISLAGLILLSSYYLHFILARKIVENKDYEISKEYKVILFENDKSFPAFIVALKSMLEFVDRYNSGVPRLKEDSPKENGSSAIFWPLGKKSISYRWDKTSDGKVKHLKLQCNPLGWFLAMIAILAGFSAISARRLYNVQFTQKEIYRLIEILCLSYASYMFVMMNMGRVMYLYHYFIALSLCFIIGILYLKLKFEDSTNSKMFLASIFIIALAQAINFYYFSPFTYHLPLSAYEFEARSWLGIWRNQLILW